jgi:hypothetical protein
MTYLFASLHFRRFQLLIFEQKLDYKPIFFLKPNVRKLVTDVSPVFSEGLESTLFFSGGIDEMTCQS